MKPWIIVLIVLAVIAVILGLLYYFGKKAQTKQAAQQEQMEAMKQTVSMLIIDKKKLRMKDSGLPQMVIDQTPSKRYIYQSAEKVLSARTKRKRMGFVGKEKRKRTAAGTSPKGSLPQFFLYENPIRRTAILLISVI